jgi:hypothetical protein
VVEEGGGEGCCRWPGVSTAGKVIGGASCVVDQVELRGSASVGACNKSVNEPGGCQ